MQEKSDIVGDWGCIWDYVFIFFGIDSTLTGLMDGPRIPKVASQPWAIWFYPVGIMWSQGIWDQYLKRVGQNNPTIEATSLRCVHNLRCARLIQEKKSHLPTLMVSATLLGLEWKCRSKLGKGFGEGRSPGGSEEYKTPHTSEMSLVRDVVGWEKNERSWVKHLS